MASTVDMTGRVFNDLTVIRRAGNTKFGEAKWLCRCSCGTEVEAAGSVLRRGTKKSCGCLWRSTFATTKVCCRCHQEKPHAEFYRGKAGVLESLCIACKLRPCSNYYRLHPEVYNARAVRVRKQRQERRARVLQAYGSKCACCGETEPMFLVVDHKNGGGAAHRRERGVAGRFYEWLEEQGFPDDYQLLCANCNWGQYANGGVCPHKTATAR